MCGSSTCFAVCHHSFRFYKFAIFSEFSVSVSLVFFMIFFTHKPTHSIEISRTYAYIFCFLSKYSLKH